MRISDVFTMGGGYGGYGHDDDWHSENPCYRGSFCRRDRDSVRKYCDPRSRRRGLAEILGGILDIL